MIAPNLKLAIDSAAERRADPAAARLSLVPKGEPHADRGLQRTYWGEVLHGRKLGRTIGFPTANIALNGERPPIGIYAARARLQDGRRRRAVAYYGDRPTVDGRGELLEIFLFGFNEDIYGQTLEVELVAFIRGDVTFPSLAAMTRQIAADCAEAAAILAGS
jgi:riboflavin kinase/FMN adenylyltransferase